jgi:hypothetical protein
MCHDKKKQKGKPETAKLNQATIKLRKISCLFPTKTMVESWKKSGIAVVYRWKYRETRNSKIDSSHDRIEGILFPT